MAPLAAEAKVPAGRAGLFVLLTLLSSLLYVACFSRVFGFGAPVFKREEALKDWAAASWGTAWGGAVLVYFLDVSYWHLSLIHI